jgi:hypothetical protein
LIVEHSAAVQEMMGISGNHYFEGDEGEEDGEVWNGCTINSIYFHQHFINGFYIYRVGGKRPKGMLFSKFKNTAQRLRKEGLLGSQYKKRTVLPEAPLSFVPSVDFEADKQRLKNCASSPWEYIKDLWISTIASRVAEMKSNKLLTSNSIYRDWPMYKLRFGRILVSKIILLIK